MTSKDPHFLNHLGKATLTGYFHGPLIQHLNLSFRYLVKKNSQ